MRALPHAAGQQHGAGDRPTPVGHGRHFGGTPTGPDDLALAAFAAQLDARLVDEPESVQPAAGELARRPC